MNIDSAFRLLGSPGCYHILVWICLGLNNIVVLVNHLVMAFYGARTDHHCKIPDGVTVNESIPFEHDRYGNWKMDSCHVYLNYSSDSNETISCPDGWTYMSDGPEWNIIMEFDLVCESAHLVPLTTTIYFCGVMLGGLLFGSFSDRLGRKPFLFLTLYAHIAVGTGIAFANSYMLFTLLRFVQGIFMQGLQTTSFVLLLELAVVEYRTPAGCGFEIFWGLGVLWLALLAYLIPNWRYLQLAITLPSLVTLGYIWLVPESPRWLMSKKKYSVLEKVFARAAKVNRVPLPGTLFKQNLEEDKPLVVAVAPTVGVGVVGGGVDIEKPLAAGVGPREGESGTEAVKAPAARHEAVKTEMAEASFLDMFRSPALRKRSFVLFYIWFVMAVGYYGLSLSLTSLAGNKYFNMFLGGLCELPAYCAALFIVRRFGRRWPLCVYLLVGGVTCLTAGLVPHTIGSGSDERDLSWLPTTLALIGRFSMAGCFSLMWLYTSELYPTVIRNVSVGACAFWMRVGGVVTPQIIRLGDLFFPLIPVIIVGGLSLLGGVVALLLPETKARRLPETLEDINDSTPSSTSSYPEQQADQPDQGDVKYAELGCQGIQREVKI